MTQPNIIWICTDQQRSDSLRCAGNPVARTPNIDTLAAGGTRFTRHNTPMQICSPSRATMFTGLYPRHHELITNGRALDPSIPTLTQLLADNGYTTHSVGKQHLQPILAPVEKHMPDSRAFWETEASERWNGPYYGFQSIDLLLGESDTATKAGHYANWIKQEHPEFINHLKVSQALDVPPDDLDEIWRSAMPAELHYNTWITNNAISFVEKQQDPFFLFVSYPDPHHPFAPPVEYADRYDASDMLLPRVDKGELDRVPDYYTDLFPKGQGFRKLYWAATDNEAGSMLTTEEISDQSMRKAIANTYAMIEMIDDGVGRLVNTLKQQGVADNTIILFTSDHGELLGTHGLLHKGPPSYRQLTEVSLIINGPGIASGATVDALTSHIDLVPTFMHLADVKVKNGAFDGVSLAPLLNAESGDFREYDFGEYHPTVRADVYNQTIRTKRWRMSIYPNNSEWGELFDLEDDPQEHNNLYHDVSKSAIKGTLAEVLAKEFPPKQSVANEMLCKW